jgi:predicted O-linked N-acetylglucosamine transferase (SPINDLY family)
MSQEQFYGLLQHGDVVLDSLDWSGNNSTMEALAFDKPVVTLPGATFRSRHSYGILQLLGCPELIAKSREEYLQIAASLSDPKVRAATAMKIHSNKSRIFEDMAPVKALEEFLFTKIKERDSTL